MKPPTLTTNSQNTIDWWSRPGVLYFIGAGDPLVAIKIGVTSVAAGKTVEVAIKQRLASLQTSNHEPLILLAFMVFMDGEFPTRQAEVVERELHIRFSAHQRFPAHSRAAEWFHAHSDIFEYIAASDIQYRHNF